MKNKTEELNISDIVESSVMDEIIEDLGQSIQTHLSKLNLEITYFKHHNV